MEVLTKEELQYYLDEYSLLDEKAEQCQDAIKRNGYELYLTGDEGIITSILLMRKSKHEYLDKMEALEKEFKKKTRRNLKDFF